MNIVMFTNVFKPFVGGVPISIDRLAQGLRKNGHNVIIFAPQYPGDEQEREGVIRCKLITFYNSERFDIPLTNIFSSKIKNQFMDMDVDVVHVHHPFWMGKLGVKLAQEKGVPSLFTYHTRYEEYLHILPFTTPSKRSQRLKRRKVSKKEDVYIIKNYLKKNVMPNFIGKFVHRVDGVILPTASMGSSIKEADKPVYILPTGLDDCSYVYDEEKVNNIRNKYIGDKDYLFVTVSRVTKEKNLKFMIGALKVLKQKFGDNFKLLVVGTGDKVEELTAYAKSLGISDNLEFTGQIENNELSSYYRACDLFVFSSLTETQGIVLLEAMAQRLPVVAVDATGVRDIIENGVNGFLTPQNKNQWAMAVNKALSMPELKDGAERTAKTYDNTIIAKKAEEIYLKAIERLKRDDE